MHAAGVEERVSEPETCEEDHRTKNKMEDTNIKV